MNNPESPPAISSRTTPTWEVELLISSVAVFAMLQLPGWLDDQVFSLEPRAGSEWRMVLLIAYFYSKSAAIVLAITFSAHLLLRAQWIALVGMHSVYPQGIRLERLRMGPIQRAIEEAQPDSTVNAIERADNRASVVFAIGVSIAFIIASVCIYFCGSLLLVTLLSQAIGWRVEPIDVMLGIFALVMLPFFAAGIFDQHVSSRLQPSHPAYRAIDAVFRLYTRIGMGRSNNRVIALLSSNGGERRMMGLVVAIMVAAIVGVTSGYLAMRSSAPVGSYAMFPDTEALRIDPGHYDDQRDSRRDEVKPFVQSLIVAGPYLKLLVPYRPRRDEHAMRDCAVPSRADEAVRAAALLACLQGLRGVQLDGIPIPGLDYQVTRDPRTDRPALLAMIDIRDLPRGRHELRIARMPLADPSKHPDEPGFDRILFWK